MGTLIRENYAPISRFMPSGDAINRYLSRH